MSSPRITKFTDCTFRFDDSSCAIVPPDWFAVEAGAGGWEIHRTKGVGSHVGVIVPVGGHANKSGVCQMMRWHFGHWGKCDPPPGEPVLTNVDLDATGRWTARFSDSSTWSCSGVTVSVHSGTWSDRSVWVARSASDPDVWVNLYSGSEDACVMAAGQYLGVSAGLNGLKGRSDA